MPTATGLPRPFEVWQYTSTLPKNDGSGEWETTTVLVNVVARGGGAYWSVTIKPIAMTGRQPFMSRGARTQLWVDASYWHSKGDFVYVGKIEDQAVIEALAAINEANEKAASA